MVCGTYMVGWSMVILFYKSLKWKQTFNLIVNILNILGYGVVSTVCVLMYITSVYICYTDYQYN